LQKKKEMVGKLKKAFLMVAGSAVQKIWCKFRTPTIIDGLDMLIEIYG
jgi:hypothetical protein